MDRPLKVNLKFRTLIRRQQARRQETRQLVSGDPRVVEETGDGEIVEVSFYRYEDDSIVKKFLNVQRIHPLRPKYGDLFSREVSFRKDLLE